MADEPDVCHAIPVFGHTFDEDTWVYRAESSYFQVGPQTQYIPSESWVGMYIAHDDNWGSNFRVPRTYLHTRRYCEQVPGQNKGCIADAGCVLYVIGTLPKKVQVNALQAEVIGADYLLSILKDPQKPDITHPWGRRLREHFDANQLVLHPILINGRNYSKHLRKVRDWGYEKLGFSFTMQDEGWLWLVELSVPELFSANQRKVGEVILRAEHAPSHDRDFKNFLFARVPGYFVFYVSGGPENPEYEFIPCGLTSHVELYGCEERS